MVRAGGSASRTIGDPSTTDSGGGDGGSRRGRPAWQLPVGCGTGHGWASDTQAFSSLGSHPSEARRHDNRQLPIRTKPVLGSWNPIGPDYPIGMGGVSLPVVPPVSRAGKNGRGCGLSEGIGCLC